MQTPKISNFTDFDALNYEPDVSVRFVGPGDVIGNPDLIILPGSKNTLADLTYLRNSGFADEIKNLLTKVHLLLVYVGAIKCWVKRFMIRIIWKEILKKLKV